MGHGRLSIELLLSIIFGMFFPAPSGHQNMALSAVGDYHPNERVPREAGSSDNR